MHLFLTSSPCDDNVPAGVDLPCIFFERNGFVENLGQRVKPGAGFVVIASDAGNYALNDEMLQTFVGCFAYHGMEFSSSTMLDNRTRDRAGEMIRRAGVVLIGGGHVPTQAAFFREIGLADLLRGHEGVIVGVSAGSMNCAATVYSQPEMPGESLDRNYQRFFPGLGLTDVMILPHYQREKNTMLDGRRLYEDITYPDSWGREFIAIPDGSYVLVEEGRAELFGEGYSIRNGWIDPICSEERSIVL